MHIRIRGMGAVSSYGAGIKPLIDGLYAGRVNAAEYRDFPLPFSNEFKVNPFPPNLLSGADGVVETVLTLAVNEALANASLDRADIKDAALIIGASGLIYEAEVLYQREKAAGVASPVPVGGRGTGRVTSRFAKTLGLRGPALTVTTACTSSANAILIAGRLIERKDAARVIVVGIEALPAFTLNGFYSLMLLSPDGCRPFDAARNGVRLGSACAAVILESSDIPSPPRPDAFLGGANLCDTHNIISTNLDGKAACEVMSNALERAGVSPCAVTAIKAHGTGSVDNDATEAVAMKTLFNGRVPPFTGFKGCLGHTLGACGAIETVALLSSLATGIIPATYGFETIDPALGISPLTKPQEAAPGYYMLNFFGFGGNNTSLVFKHGNP